MDTDGSGEISIDEFVDGRDECEANPCEVGVQGIGDELAAAAAGMGML